MSILTLLIILIIVGILIPMLVPIDPMAANVADEKQRADG